LAFGSQNPPQTTLFLLLVWGDEGVVRTLFLLEALGEILFPFLFQLVEAVCVPWLVVSSAIFKAAMTGGGPLALHLWDLFFHF